MKRSLLVLGSVLSIAGASGLVVFGGSIVGILDGAMTFRITDPLKPLPASLGQIGWAAMSGVALALGLAVSCVATAMRDSQQTTSLSGKILQVVAGVLLLIGTMPVLWGIMVAKKGFTVVCMSSVTPKPEDFQEMIEAASPGITVGCFVLLLGAVFMLVAGQIGLRTNPSPTIGTRSMFGVFAARAVMLLGVLAAFIFFGVWLNGNALGAIFANAERTPKASQLALHLMVILNRSLLAFSILGCQGILQAVVGVFAPMSHPSQGSSQMA
jgi:hypothetical protein